MLDRILRVGLLVWMCSACSDRAEETVDLGSARDQIGEAVRSFAIANEFHHAAHGRFVAEVDSLQAEFEWAPDSVQLRVSLASSGQGWAVVATHPRVGPDIGCVLAWGEDLPAATPGGMPHDGSNQMRCDPELETAGSQ